jgi:hypothetical protein
LISCIVFLFALFGGCFESNILGKAKIGDENYLAVEVINHCDTMVSLASPFRYSVLWKRNGRLHNYSSSHEDNGDPNAPSIRLLPSSSVKILLPFLSEKIKPKDLSISIF